MTADEIAEYNRKNRINPDLAELLPMYHREIGTILSCVNTIGTHWTITIDGTVPDSLSTGDMVICIYRNSLQKFTGSAEVTAIVRRNGIIDIDCGASGMVPRAMAYLCRCSWRNEWVADIS